MLKKDLIKENEALKEELEAVKSNHTIVQNCNFDCSDDGETLAIAEAVKEAMKALQMISSANKTGLTIEGG